MRFIKRNFLQFRLFQRFEQEDFSFFDHFRESVDIYGNGRESVIVHRDDRFEIEKVIASVGHRFHIGGEVPSDAENADIRTVELVY